MALIKCNECKKEMSDTLKKCPHCGFINKDIKKEKNFFQKKRKLMIIIGIIIIACIAGFVVYSNILTDDEKVVVSVVKKLQDSLKNPDSLQIFEIRYDKKDNKIYAVIIDASAQNGYGGVNRSKYLYSITEDGEISYVANDYNANKNVTKYTSADDRAKIAVSLGVKMFWDGSEDFIFADVKKIMRNLYQVN